MGYNITKRISTPPPPSAPSPVPPLLFPSLADSTASSVEKKKKGVGKST
ncbi:uncharacterized protein G2W53_040409 [Senna tora]|uniref:Uncharacterized protein n=1 Tax=Senna tora TaxID=362788 RepID=A0A834SF99_9FABA|nr:uncharacterized protein G2W53_040409 [Senna tora]